MKKTKKKRVFYGLLSMMLTIALALTNLEGLYPAMTVHAATQYFMNVIAFPMGAGMIGGMGYYEAGTSVTMIAEPEAGYTFEAWIDPVIGMQYEENPYVFTAERSRTFYALFRKNGQYFIYTPSTVGGSLDILQPADAYLSQDPGTTVVLTAEPEDGYRFETFFIKDSKEGESRPLTGNTFTMPAHDVWVGAKFVSTVPHTVNLSGDLEHGTITFDAGKNSFMEGDVVNITVKPDYGYEVEQLAGVPAGTTFSGSQLSFVMPGYDVNITVTYKKLKEINIQFVVYPPEGGSITAVSNVPGTISVTATANEGYSFVGWYASDNLNTPLSTETAATFTLDKEMTIYAIFKKGSYNVRAGAYPAGSGTVTGEQDQLTGMVTLSATANYGYRFAYWYDSNTNGVASRDNPYVFVPTSDVTLVAIFDTLQTFVVHNDAEITHGSLTIANPREKYVAGETIQLVATPESGYVVDHYYVATSADLHDLTPLDGDTFEMPVSDVWVYADFVRQYDVNATQNFAAIGTVSGGGTYKENETVSLIATPKDGCRFVNWTENGNVVSTSATYQFQITADRELVANFLPEGYSEITFCADFESGSLDGWTQYDFDDDDRCWEIGEGVNGKALQPNTYRILSYAHRAKDLIVTPGITVPENGELSFWCKREEDFEDLELYVFNKLPSNGNSMPKDFLEKQIVTIDSNYKKFTFSLERYKGQTIFIGFGNPTMGKNYNIIVDDVMVASKQKETMKVEKKSLTLFDTITIDFKVPTALVDGKYHDPYLMVTQNGAEEKLTKYTVDTTNGFYVFSYRVAPHNLRDVVTAVPHALDASGADVAGEECTYSVEEYCHNMLNNEKYQTEDYAKFRKLLVDILLYGDAAQKYVGYKTDELASYRLTDAQRAMGTDVTIPMTYASVKDPEADPMPEDAYAEIVGASLLLEGAVNVQFKVNTANVNGLKLVILDENREAIEALDMDPSLKDTKGRYYVSFKGLNAGQMRKTIYAAVIDRDGRVSNGYRYSIESYVAGMKGKGYGEAFDNLLDAMMRYGDSAADYVKK